MRLFALLALAACSRPTLIDRDADGATKWTDCDDGDDDVHPGAAERCNGEDDDCDGEVDEDATEAVERWRDADGDGYGADDGQVQACPDDVAGTAGFASDCDDDEGEVNPSAEESCLTDADDDCDGQTNEADAFACTTWYADADGDGAPGWETTCRCEADADWLAGPPTDCDDADPARMSGCGLLGETALAAPLSRIVGDRGNSFLGVALTAGDVDGDGVTDLLLGSSGDNADLVVLRGPFLGDRDAAAADLDLTLAGTYGPSLGASADLTGDGAVDLVVAQHFTSGAGGWVWVVEWGRASWGPVEDQASWTTPADGRISFGVGDVTGDGLPDLVVGDYERAAGVFPGPLGDAEAIDVGSPGTLAHALHAGTDLDGDGFGDLALAAEGHDESAPALWILSGPLDEDRDLTDVDAVVTHPASVDGPAELIAAGDCDGDGLPDLALSDDAAALAWVLPGTLRGAVDAADRRIVFVEGLSDDSSLEPLGDLDGDDHADLAIGAPFDDGYMQNAGVVGIWQGEDHGDLEFSDLLLHRGLSGGDRAGVALAAGDLDDDGVIDLAVSAPCMDLGGTDAGGAWLLPGAP